MTVAKPCPICDGAGWTQDSVEFPLSIDRYPPNQWIFQDATGLNTVHITVKPEDQHPAMVEADPLGTLLPFDAEALGLAIVAAARQADPDLSTHVDPGATRQQEIDDNPCTCTDPTVPGCPRHD